MPQPTTVLALDGSNVPVTGLTPTWLFYGSLAGVNYSTARQPQWRELTLGNYVFTPYAADKSARAVWVADFGASVARRYRCGVVGDGYQAFIRVASGVPAGTTPPTVITRFSDNTTASPTAPVTDLSASLAGLFVQPEPVIGIGLNQRKPWSQKGSVSYVDLGGDALYRYQSAWWGYGDVEAMDLSQFNILAVWPTDLPQEPFGEASASYSSRDNVIRTENETGPAQLRRRHTTKVDLFNCTVVLTPDQMASLEYFYRTTLRETQKFTWTDFRTLLPCQYRFLAPPAAEYWASESDPHGHWWRVQLQFEVFV